MTDDTLNGCEETSASRLWWERIKKFLEYRKRVGMTPADQEGTWLIPTLYGIDGYKRRTPKQIAARTVFTEHEILLMKDYMEGLIHKCIGAK